MSVKACCKEPANLVEVPIDAHRSCNVCRACGCRHFRLKADPGLLGLRGSSLGPRNEPEPEQDLELRITLKADGTCSVVGPIENKVVAYGMLKAAEDVIRDSHLQAVQAALLGEAAPTVQ